MKKVLSLFLALCLSIGLAVPALAASNSMDNFKKTNIYNRQFTDVPSSHWAIGSVKICYEYGLMNGVSAKTFRPDGQLTVAQAIVMADRVHEIYTTGKSTLKNGTPWYEPYIQYALKNGIIKKNDFKNYNDKISRAQMAYIFSRALPSSVMGAINDIQYLPDVNSRTPYSSSIFTLYKAGVLTGNDVYGTFRPNSSIKRAEAAAIISRVAIPSQRKHVILLKKLTWKNLALAVPQDAEIKKSDEGVYSILSDKINTGTILTVEQDPAHKGSSIDILSAKQMDEILLNSFKETNLGLTGKGSELVTFGQVKAYRTQGTMRFGQDFMGCVIYTYIYQDTMVIAAIMAPYGHEVLKNMANNMYISGHGVRPPIQ